MLSALYSDVSEVFGSAIFYQPLTEILLEKFRG
jgi:hypothetical protein